MQLIRCLILSGLLGTWLTQQARAELPAPGPWNVEFESGFGLTQASYSDNFEGGDAAALAWLADLHLSLERQFSSIWFSSSDIRLAFGQTHDHNEETESWMPPKKTSDRIHAETILRYTHNWFAEPYLAGTLESQFLDVCGSQPQYLNPIDITETVGFTRCLVDNPDVTMIRSRFGAGFREFLKRGNDTTSSATNPGVTRHSGGLEWVTEAVFGSPQAKYTFGSKLTLFQALIKTDARRLRELPQGNYWKALDLSWDNQFDVNITSLLQVSLAWQILYDKEISKAGRYRETLSLGFAYRFESATDTTTTPGPTPTN